jgi:hypothetical protein
MLILAITTIIGCQTAEDTAPEVGSDSSAQGDPLAEDNPLADAGRLVLLSTVGEIMADGRSKLSLTIEARNAGGRLVADGLDIPMVASLGQVTDVSPSSGGIVTVQYTAGTWPGEARLSAPRWPFSGQDSFTLNSGDSISAQMHIHGSLSEGNASMAYHTEQARGTNVDLLWWTDHDYFYYPEHFLEIDGAQFDRCVTHHKMETWPTSRTTTIAWELQTSNAKESSFEALEEAAMAGKCGARISAKAHRSASQQFSIYTQTVTPRFNYKSLLGDVSLSFSFRPEVDNDAAELFVYVPLSESAVGESDSASRQIRFYYSSNDDTKESNSNIYYVEMKGTPGEWASVSHNITDLARAHFGDDAVDLHAEFIRIVIATSDAQEGSFDIDSIRWEQAHVGEQLRQRQEEYLSSLPEPTMHLVGQEISLLGQLHLNAFGPSVPFVPYWKGDLWDGNSVTDFVRSHGGLTACTHMFGVGVGISDEGREEMVEDVTQDLLQTNAHGCELIEVGYRARIGALQDFLTVWDTLGTEGIYLTGLGVSDIHNQADWRTYINNFVTWIQTASSDESDLMWGLQRGAAWFGDASYFPDGVEMTFQAPAHSATMGQIVVGAAARTQLVIGISTLPKGATVSLVRNGAPLERWLASEGAFAATTTVDPTGGAVYRVEVVAKDETELLYSNPLYFVDTDSGLLPPDRLPAP